MKCEHCQDGVPAEEGSCYCTEMRLQSLQLAACEAAMLLSSFGHIGAASELRRAIKESER